MNCLGKITTALRQLFWVGWIGGAMAAGARGEGGFLVAKPYPWSPASEAIPRAYEECRVVSGYYLLKNKDGTQSRVEAGTILERFDYPNVESFAELRNESELANLERELVKWKGLWLKYSAIRADLAPTLTALQKEKDLFAGGSRKIQGRWVPPADLAKMEREVFDQLLRQQAKIEFQEPVRLLPPVPSGPREPAAIQEWKSIIGRKHYYLGHDVKWEIEVVSADTQRAGTRITRFICGYLLDSPDKHKVSVVVTNSANQSDIAAWKAFPQVLPKLGSIVTIHGSISNVGAQEVQLMPKEMVLREAVAERE